MLRLVEWFYSIQGEGKYAGANAIFFRFAGCNLRCKGFKVEQTSPKTNELLIGCDTIRAVYIRHFDYENIKNSNQLFAKIDSLGIKHKPIIVITGGEPLLHYKNSIFYEFISELLKFGYEVHFETNGTVEIDFNKYEIYKKCIFCISPKLSNSLETKEKRINYKALKLIKENAKDSFYKFVISKSFDLKDEILEITNNAPNSIFCMPMSKNKEQLEKNANYVFNFCLENGYNYSDRLHIRIFDNKDGI